VLFVDETNKKRPRRNQKNIVVFFVTASSSAQFVWTLTVVATHEAAHTMRRAVCSRAASVPLRGCCGIAYDPFERVRAGRRKQPMTQTPKEDTPIFPKTLKSGRYDGQKSAVQMMEAAAARKRMRDDVGDRRFMRKVQDYTEIGDEDPLRGTLFKESAAAVKVRERAWQKQFEEENEGVWLPYERTSFLARTAPNWFVKRMVALRDNGGANSGWYIVAPMSAFLLLLFIIGGLLQPARDPNNAIDVAEVR
jgi:hypothetical protein